MGQTDWEGPAGEQAAVEQCTFCMQGAGSMLAAVVAIYAQLQALPAQHLIRSPAIIWPLPQAAQLLQTWDNYSADHASSELLEASLSYATVPGIGETRRLAQPKMTCHVAQLCPDNAGSAAHFEHDRTLNWCHRRQALYHDHHAWPSA